MKYPPAAEMDEVRSHIRMIRDIPVILDADLARVHGVTTGRLNEQVSRNRDRFPLDFAFRLTPQEAAALKSQFAISNAQLTVHQGDTAMRSRFATASGRGGRRTLPFAFTEHGAMMAAMVLNSPRAVQMSVFVVRPFLAMRSLLVSQQGLAKKLAELEQTLTARLDTHEHAITDIIQQIMRLLTPPPPEPEPPRPRIGFGVKERRAVYRTANLQQPGKGKWSTACTA